MVHIDIPNPVDEYSTVGEFSHNQSTRVPYVTQDSGDYVSLASVTAEARMIASLQQQSQDQMNIIQNAVPTSSVGRRISEDADEQNPVFDHVDTGQKQLDGTAKNENRTAEGDSVESGAAVGGQADPSENMDISGVTGQENTDRTRSESSSKDKDITGEGLLGVIYSGSVFGQFACNQTTY